MGQGFKPVGRHAGEGVVSSNGVVFGPGVALRANSEYMVGTTKMVSKVPKLMPPTITQPIC